MHPLVAYLRRSGPPEGMTPHQFRTLQQELNRIGDLEVELAEVKAQLALALATAPKSRKETTA